MEALIKGMASVPDMVVSVPPFVHSRPELYAIVINSVGQHSQVTLDGVLYKLVGVSPAPKQAWRRGRGCGWFANRIRGQRQGSLTLRAAQTSG